MIKIMKYPSHLITLIQLLKRLPGVGSKSAERFAFDILQWPAEQQREVAEAIGNTNQRLFHCGVCGCLKDHNPCAFCPDERLAPGVLCVISTARDAFAVEAIREFKGTYHVLGGLLSPMEGIGPELLAFDSLLQRLNSGQIREVIIALDSTLEGDATALYLKQLLADIPVAVSRLAFGLPMGSSLDYVDGGTLARAFSGRSAY
jgi:recombination protein RecR